MTHPVQIINRSSVVSDADLLAMVAALQIQVKRDFAPLWGVDAGLGFVSKADKPDPTAWWISVLDTSDEAGALGYHDLTSAGLPLGKVFAKTDLQYKSAVSVTLSHELLEMLGDPWINATVERQVNGRSLFYAYEACLAAETMMRLPAGDVPISKLVCAPEFDVVAMDLTGRERVVRAHSVRRTQRSAHVVRIGLSNGEHVRCTPDHRFLLADGSWCRADRLRPGSRLAHSSGRENLLPSDTLASPCNSREANSVLNRERVERGIAQTDGYHVGLGQRSRPDLGTVPIPVSAHPPFGDGIQHVTVMVGQKEMIGADAPRSVAAMADERPLRNWANVQLPGEAMGQVDLSGVSDLAVAGRAFGASPEPAAVGLLNARPPTGRQVGPGAVVRAESSVNIPVAAPAPPVSVAQPAGAERPATPGYRAGPQGITVLFVESDGRSDVFDFTVPGFHNALLAAGILAHNCDAVEDDSLGYQINGIQVSDFVTPAWFQPFKHAKATAFSFGKHVSQPFQLAKGGYASVYDPTKGGWKQLTAQTAPGGTHFMTPELAQSIPMEARARVGSRRERRRLGACHWLRSVVETH